MHIFKSYFLFENFDLIEIPKEHQRLVEKVVNKQLKPNPEERITADEVYTYLQVEYFLYIL